MWPDELRTVPSYCTTRSSTAFVTWHFNSAMLSVSRCWLTMLSRHDLAWKKNSCGVNPDKNELCTYPLLSGPQSLSQKCGSVLFLW